jgi:hypothetical protein
MNERRAKYGVKQMIILKYSLVFILSILCSMVIACQPIVDEMLPTPMPTKAFLPNVSPDPGERISYDAYKAKLEADESGFRETGPICVFFVALEVLEYGDDGFRKEDYLSRSVLVINGEVWPNSKEPDFSWDFLGQLLVMENPETGESSQIKGNDTGPYYFCWDVELDPGMHTIEFKTKKTSGEELAYRWSFLITE